LPISPFRRLTGEFRLLIASSHGKSYMYGEEILACIIQSSACFAGAGTKLAGVKLKAMTRASSKATYFVNYI